MDTDSLSIIRVHPCSSVVELISLQGTSFVSFVSFCEKKIGSTLFFTEGNEANEVVHFSNRELSRSNRQEAHNVDRFFNHGCTRMDTDSLSIIRVHPCSSVVELIWLQLGPTVGSFRTDP